MSDIKPEDGHDSIPEAELLEPDTEMEPAEFAEADVDTLAPSLRDAVKRVGWKSLTPVQAKAIPYMLAKRDLTAQSRTGSGKTGAFVLPMLELLDPGLKRCQALVLVPTRELARQVSEAVDLLCAGSELSCTAVYGGVGFGPQADGIRAGSQIIVGTPGRLLDHLMRKTLSLEHLELLVFDEADQMLSMGFYPDMIEVRKYLPKRDITSCMFSATFPAFVNKLVGRFLRDPERLSLSQDHVHVTDIAHVCYDVPAMEKSRGLVRILELENPQSAIIFCNTKSNVHFVNVVLQRFGFDADELCSDLSQNARERVLTRVRSGALRFLVATDVAARGIDIPDLSHVIQYDVPEDPESYIHRAGRTGRAGASGKAVILASGLDFMSLGQIEKRYEINFDKCPVPTEEDVTTLVSERLTALLEAKLRSLDNVQKEKISRFTSLGRSLAESEDESAVIAMLLADYYERSLHTPPAREQPEKEAEPEKAPQNRGGGRGDKRRPRRSGGDDKRRSGPRKGRR